jgi:UrcA family protein
MNPIRILPLALLAFAVPAIAETARVPVSYSGLDLTTPAGVAALDARIENAVQEICGQPFPASLQSRFAIRRCQDEARASVQSQRSSALAQAQSRGVQMASRGN